MSCQRIEGNIEHKINWTDNFVYVTAKYKTLTVRGDISRETNGPNIRAMVSLGILFFLGTFLVWQTD